MRLTDLVWVVALVGCKSSAEKCFTARDKASAAWLAAADAARPAAADDPGAKAHAALETMQKIPATLWPCTLARSLAAGESIINVEYVRTAPNEVRERIATAQQLVTLPQAGEAEKIGIATAIATLEKALPELEKQVATAKLNAKPAPALVAAAKPIDAACTQLLTLSAALAGAAQTAAQAQYDTSQKAVTARIAELQQHNALMKEILYAATQVGSAAPPGAITVPATLADDPRFADARKLTQAAHDACKK